MYSYKVVFIFVAAIPNLSTAIIISWKHVIFNVYLTYVPQLKNISVYYSGLLRFVLAIVHSHINVFVRTLTKNRCTQYQFMTEVEANLKYRKYFSLNSMNRTSKRLVKRTFLKTLQNPSYARSLTALFIYFNDFINMTLTGIVEAWSKLHKW